MVVSMKVRNYEKKSLITILVALTIIIEISTLITIYAKKEFNYQVIPGVIVKDNLVLVMVNKEKRKIIYSNKKLYLNDKKYTYSIVEDRGIILKKDKEKYYELVLKIIHKQKNKYKTNDSINLVFASKKQRLIEMFKIIWKE